MPADIHVLISGSSPVTFAYDYLVNGASSKFGDDLCEILTEKSVDFGGFPRGGSYDRPFRCGSAIIRKEAMPVAVPRRPCLAVRCDALDLSASNKSKKRVVFADDRGFPLALVRTMTEPSDMPPQWSFQFIAKVTKGACSETDLESWEVAFPQPASDYLDFRRRLDSNNVSLENVIVKDCEAAGTVKVRNLAFQKEVSLRITENDWKTETDVPCTYVASGPTTHGVTVLYDTFSFRIPLPTDSLKLQFCVRFRCAGFEHWDNNFGQNYSVIKKRQGGEEKKPMIESQKRIKSKIDLSKRFSDDVRPDAQLDSWSEFASWNHLENRTPYW